jgi:hypothetical protein
MPIIGESPEFIAYQLLRGIAGAEGKVDIDGLVVADRQWLLNAYAECIQVVKETKPTQPMKISPEAVARATQSR